MGAVGSSICWTFPHCVFAMSPQVACLGRGKFTFVAFFQLFSIVRFQMFPETRGWRYKVVEHGGRQVRSIVCRNPWTGPCRDPQCMICSTGGTGNCRKPGCTYQVQCIACKERGPDAVPHEEEQGGGRRGEGEVGKPCVSLYHRESGYSGFVRGLDH